MRRPRDAFLLATLLLGGLWFVAPDTPMITPAQAPEHDGRHVRMQGNVVDVTAWDGGGTIRLAHLGAAIAARIDGPLPPLGAWIEAAGDLRRDGALTLWVDAWTVAAAPAASFVPLAVLAADPQTWANHRVRVQGDLHDDALHDQGRRLPLGDGPRLGGAVAITGVVTYAPRCFCHVLHVDDIRPWMP